MKKLLILVKKYPTEEEPYALTYVHSRSIEYKKRGINFDILSFDCRKPYEYQGINIITSSYAATNIDSYTHIISHAPNLRQHIRFLLSHCKGKTKIFFLHGHEILLKSRHYPAAYDFLFKNKLHKLTHRITNDLYDIVKIKILRYLISQTKNSKYVLVSNHLKNLAQTDLNKHIPPQKTFIINNCVNNTFIESSYAPLKIKGDVITIRQLDNSTYCLDIVRRLALSNPELSFTVYGKGDFFNHNSLPDNITVVKRFFKHDQLPEILSSHRAALMPTRHDTQGVMSCEMATFGIPLITSNIDVCKEIFSGMPNVALINNNSADSNNLGKIIQELELNKIPPNKEKFNPTHTIEKELSVIFNTK